MEKHKEPIGENCQNGILNCETSGTPKPNVPALRFPEFSGEWERCALAEICSIVGRIGFRGYTIQDIVEKGTGAIALSPSNITDNRLSYDKDNTYISYFKYEESPEIKVFVGDIVFVKTGSTVGKVAYVDNILCETTLNPQLVVLKNIKCNSFLLGQILSASKFQNAIKRITVGGAVPTLSQNEMGKISVSIPQKMEQEKLATLFHLIDERIATQNKIIEDLRLLRDAISVCLLSPKSDWKCYKVSEIADIGRGRVISSKEIANQNNPQYPVYSSQTSNEGVMGYLDNYAFDGEYITWTTDGANAGTVFYRNGRFNCTNVCGTLKLHYQFDAYYCSLVLANATKKYVSVNLANPKLMNNTMAAIKLYLPPFQEQKRMAQLFRKMDENITLEHKLLLSYQKQKHYLLQQMFI